LFTSISVEEITHLLSEPYSATDERYLSCSIADLFHALELLKKDPTKFAALDNSLKEATLLHKMVRSGNLFVECLDSYTFQQACFDGDGLSPSGLAAYVNLRQNPLEAISTLARKYNPFE
jgi:hypothetical protein